MKASSCITATLGVILYLTCTATWTQPAQAQTFDEQYLHWPENLKINGRIVVSRGLTKPDRIRSVLARAIGEKPAVCIHWEEDTATDWWLETLKSVVGEGQEIADLRSADPPIKLLVTAIASSKCVVLGTATQKIIHELKRPLKDLVDRGGTLIVDVSLAEHLGKWKVTESNTSDQIRITEGLNLLPDCILQPSDLNQAQFLKILTDHRRSVGLSLDAESAFVLSGRKLTCYGKGQTTLLLPSTEFKPSRIESIAVARSRRQPPESYLADLTEWRRDAIDRDLEPFPSATPQTPKVDNGTLLIVGGGGTPKGLTQRFIELAGGIEKARLIYVPCSESETVDANNNTIRNWQRLGVQHATVLHTKDRRKANTDKAFLAPLKTATGIFFGGGRQWNFADSYYGTQAHWLMKEVLSRGGVIAGSSAGASIQARYLARATPIGNDRIMAPGYERGGLGFISGVAIDQHFSQRKRQKDMMNLMDTHKQLLGIGIDEATAIEVQQSTATVSGRGRVFFYNAKEKAATNFVALPAGSTYNLATRKTIVDTTKQE